MQTGDDVDDHFLITNNDSVEMKWKMVQVNVCECVCVCVIRPIMTR